jgi:hypothetical protein
LMRENKKLNTGILHFVQDDDVRRGGSIFEPRKAWSARKRGTPFGIPPFSRSSRSRVESEQMYPIR